MTEAISDSAASGTTPAGEARIQAGLLGFLFAVRSGEDLELLVLQDTARQRRAACALRSARREQQMRAAHEAADKLRQVAGLQMRAALLNAGLQIAFSLAGAALDDAFSGTPREFSWSRLAAGAGLEAAKAFTANYTPYFTKAIAENQARSGELQAQADIEAQQARDASDWLQSARELESRLISHLERQIELEGKNPSL